MGRFRPVIFFYQASNYASPRLLRNTSQKLATALSAQTSSEPQAYGKIILGLIALKFLPVTEYPEVVPPTVIVRATYPGANPKTIAETVSSPLEQVITGVENSIYMSSQATTDGVMTLTVTK